MADAATLVINLDANSAKLVTELLKATKETQRATRQMAGHFAQL